MYIMPPRGHLDSTLNKSLPSVLPTLQPLELLTLSLYTALMPAAIFMKLGMYVMTHEAISRHTS
jgi:hypothetical protein